MAFSFTIIINVAITTQKFVNNMGTKFFGNAVFKSVTQTIFRLENNFNVTLGSLLLKQLFNLDLKFKQNWPKNGKTIKIPFLGTVIKIIIGT